MSCTLQLKTTYLPNASTGGSWNLVGHSLTENGTYSLNSGSWPWSNNSNDDPLVNFQNIDHGYYKLSYFVGGVCGGAQEIIVPVIGGGNAGISKTINACTNTSLINVSQELGVEFDDGAFQPTFTYSGTGTVGSAFNSNPNTPIGATFDPSQAVAGSYIIALTITPTTVPNYTLAGCTSCNETTAILTINISENTLEISLTGCEITLTNQTGCESATKNVQRYDGSSWQTVSTVLPYTITTDGSHRVIANCSCGTVYSNVVVGEGCCCSVGTFSTSGLYYDSDSCFLTLVGSSCTCSGGCQYQYEYSTNGVDNWQNYGGVINGAGSTLIFPNQSGYFRLKILNCVGCSCISNVVHVTCASACNGTITGTQTGCTYNVTVTPCSSGFWQWQKLVGSSWTTQTSGNGVIPLSHTATSSGQWRLVVDCQNGCPVFYSVTLTFSSCGSSCNASASISSSGCTLTVNTNNCTGATYQWTLNGNNISGATGTSYTASVNGTYSCIVSCSGCPPIQTNSISLSSCESNPCICTANISQSNCNLSLFMNCPGYIWNWQYRANGGATWANIQSGGSTHTPSNNGQYRVVLSKPGCSNVVTNIESVSCVASGCQVQITSMVVDPNDCSKVIVQWSGAGGSNVSVQFSKATVGTNCSDGQGWQVLSGATMSASTNGTGTASITLGSNDCDKCIRAIVDAGNEGCGIAIGTVYAPCCCTGSLTITDQCREYLRCIRFQNVNDSEHIYPSSPTYFLTSVTVNGTSRLNAEIPFRAKNPIQIGSYDYYQSFKDTLNNHLDVATPELNFENPTAAEILSSINAAVSVPARPCCVAIEYHPGTTWEIKYRYNPNPSLEWKFTMTEVGCFVELIQNGTVYYSGPPEGGTYYWYNELLCTTITP